MNITDQNQTTQPKPTGQSGWILVLHFWAGICLKTLVEGSGLSNAVFGNPSFQSSEDRMMHIGLSTLFTIAVVGVGCYLSYLLIKFIDSKGFSSKMNKTIKISLPFLYFFGTMFLYMLLRPIFRT